MMIRLFFILLILSASSPMSAQPYAGDFYMCTPGRVPSGPHMYGGLFAVNTRGTQRTVSIGTSYSGLAMDNNNMDLVLSTPTSLLVINPSTNQILRTIWSGHPFKYINDFTPTHTGDFLVCSNDMTSPYTVFLVNHDGSGVTTILTGGSGVTTYAYLQDLATGDIVESSQNGLRSFSLKGGAMTTVYSGNSTWVAQDHHDGSFILNGPAGLQRYHRTRGLSTLRTGMGYGCIAFDRGRGKGEILTGYGNVFRIDGKGNILSTITCILGGIKMRFNQGRNLLSRRLSPGLNSWMFHLDFPGDGSRPYVLGLSYSGFTPGIPVDSRAIPLNLDPLLRMSVTGGFAPFLKNNVGLLGPSGIAVSWLDVSSLGGMLKGVRIWAAALTLHKPAPSGIATISKPIVVVLE